MLLSMRRTEEPDKKRVKIEEEDSEYQEEYYKSYQRHIPGYEPGPSIDWKEERKPETGLDASEQSSVDESILERLSVCSVTVEPDVKTEKNVQKPNKKRSFVRQFGVREESRQENEYVDITQVQQLLLDSATTSGKGASSKNRTSESQSRDCQQQFTQEQLTGRSLSFSETNKTPIRTVLRPHSQPSCSTLPGDYTKSQQGYFRSPDRLYPQQGRQIEYFSSTGRVQQQDQTGKPRMLAEGLPTPPHLQPPTPSTGGHSPNVEELFALWFGTPSGNAGWFHYLNGDRYKIHSRTNKKKKLFFFFITYHIIISR